jgi:hypothetical protein
VCVLRFDEASDVQMHGKLNLFVITCLYTGEVKTLTLALHGLYIVHCNIEYFSEVYTFSQCQSLVVTHYRVLLLQIIHCWPQMKK